MALEFFLPSASRHLLADDGGSMVGGPPRGIEHITADPKRPDGGLPDFAGLVNFFTHGGKRGAPHLLADPCSGEHAQFFPANVASRALVHDAGENPGSGETNRFGSVCLQIEWRFSTAGRCPVHKVVHANLNDTPMLGLAEIRDWQAQFAIPLVWAMGEPTWTPRRDPAVWKSTAGYYGHSQVPWQAPSNHVDPGPMPLTPAVHVRGRTLEVQPLAEEDEMVILKNTAGTDCWLSDGLQRRHIADVASLAEWQKVCRTVPATPFELNNILDVTPGNSQESIDRFDRELAGLSDDERNALGDMAPVF
jgi:hypothetical protein